jgi:hypothetical protein
MKKHILYYNKLVKKYNKYQRKLNRAETSIYHHKRKDVLLKRIGELFERIQQLKHALRTAVGGGAIALSMMLTPIESNAQSLTFESPSQAGLAHAENLSVPTFFDIDGDGDLDMIIGERYGTTDGGIFTYLNEGGQFLRNSDIDGFNLQIDSVHNIPNSNEGGGFFAPDYADYDGDGDLDFFVGQTNGDGSVGVQYDRIRFFENESGSFAEKFGADNPLSSFTDGDNTKPTFVDLDNDGDLDVAIGKGNGEIVYWENDGSGNYAAAATNPFAGFFSGEDSPNNARINFADIDGDGDLDAVVGHKEGNFTYLENTGSAEAPVFAEVTGANNPFDGLTFGDFSAPSPEFADIDGDGDLDLFIGNLNGPVLFVENDGGNYTLQPENSIGLPDIGDNAYPESVDWDEDGDMDVVVSNGGSLSYYEKI